MSYHNTNNLFNLPVAPQQHAASNYQPNHPFNAHMVGQQHAASNYQPHPSFSVPMTGPHHASSRTPSYPLNYPFNAAVPGQQHTTSIYQLNPSFGAPMTGLQNTTRTSNYLPYLPHNAPIATQQYTAPNAPSTGPLQHHSGLDEPNDAADPALDWLKADENVDRIRRAYTLKGGWEGWAQVELALALEDYKTFSFRDPGEAQRAARTVVKREVPVYPPVPTSGGHISQKKADIVVKYQSGQRWEYFIIELKCEGEHNGDAFVGAVEADVKKLRGDIKNEFKPATLWAFAISTSQKSYDRLLEVEDPENKRLKLKDSENRLFLYPDSDMTVAPGQPKIVLWVLEKETR